MRTCPVSILTDRFMTLKTEVCFFLFICWLVFDEALCTILFLEYVVKSCTLSFFFVVFVFYVYLYLPCEILIEIPHFLSPTALVLSNMLRSTTSTHMSSRFLHIYKTQINQTVAHALNSEG